MNEENKVSLVGQIFYESWGYNMTHNDFVEVVSETDKSVMVRMIGNTKLTGGGYTGDEIPNKDVVSNGTFRLLKRVQTWGDGGVYLKGSYPFCSDSTSKRMGSFRVWSGRPVYYNTVD